MGSSPIWLPCRRPELHPTWGALELVVWNACLRVVPSEGKGAGAFISSLPCVPKGDSLGELLSGFHESHQTERQLRHSLGAGQGPLRLGGQRDLGRSLSFLSLSPL